MIGTRCFKFPTQALLSDYITMRKKEEKIYIYLKDVKMVIHFLGHALLYCAPHFHKCGHIIATCHTYMPSGASIRWNRYVSRFDTTLHTLHIQGTYSQSFLVPFSESTVWENFEEKKNRQSKASWEWKCILAISRNLEGFWRLFVW